MTVQRRWIRRMIETAKADSTPMPWTIVRNARQIVATKPAIRTTLQPKNG